MNKGIVKFFNEQKGFGFISDGNEEYFVHATGLNDRIKENDKVSYDLERGKKGLSAINVKVIY